MEVVLNSSKCRKEIDVLSHIFFFSKLFINKQRS